MKSAESFGVLLAIMMLCTACGDLKAEVQAGLDFGGDHTLEECVSESLRRLESCDSFKCEALSTGFSRGCSEVASMGSRFCARVPDSLVDAVGWMRTECTGSSNMKACAKVLQQPVKRCLEGGAG